MRKTLWIVFVFIFLVAENNGCFAANRIVFRYSADLDAGSSLITPVSLKNVRIAHRNDYQESVSRGAGGWGFTASKAAYFDGATSMLITDETVAIPQTFGIALTCEIWYKKEGESIGATLLSNIDSLASYGFSLGLYRERVRFTFLDESSRYDVFSVGTAEDEEWHWLLCTLKQENELLWVRFYIDGNFDSDAQIPNTSNRESSTFRSKVLLGTRYQQGAYNCDLEGQIHAATIKSYVVRNVYSASSPSFDGSSYFGLPAYHDYSLTGYAATMDQRIFVNPTEVADYSFVPYQNDDYIPQGVTTRCDEYANLVYISLYHRTLQGSTGGINSIVVELDADRNLRVRRCFRLTGRLRTSHVGGIAYGLGSIYVASQSKIERYPLPDYLGQGIAKYQDLAPDPLGYYVVNSLASFLTCHKDTLWVGDYLGSGSGTPYIYGYALDSDGHLRIEPNPKRYAVPNKTQGMAFYDMTDDTYAFVSTSGGDNDSRIYRFKKSQLSQYWVPNADTVFIVPAGGEGLAFFPNGKLWTVSESGAKYYQKRNANRWTTFYPFVYSIPDQVILRGIKESTTVLMDPHSGLRQLSNIRLMCFPCPSNSTIRINYELSHPAHVQMTLFDCRGRVVDKIIDGYRTLGEYSLIWDLKHYVSGVYFLYLATPGGNRKFKFTVLK